MYMLRTKPDIRAKILQNFKPSPKKTFAIPKPSAPKPHTHEIPLSSAQVRAVKSSSSSNIYIYMHTSNKGRQRKSPGHTPRPIHSTMA